MTLFISENLILAAVKSCKRINEQWNALFWQNDGTLIAGMLELNVKCEVYHHQLFSAGGRIYISQRGR